MICVVFRIYVYKNYFLVIYKQHLTFHTPFFFHPIC